MAKVFAMADNLVAVPNNMICEAVKFLILHAQQPDGMFKEVGKVYHGEMIVRFPFAPHFYSEKGFETGTVLLRE